MRRDLKTNTTVLSKELLDEFNQDLPKGVDWKAGARRLYKIRIHRMTL